MRWSKVNIYFRFTCPLSRPLSSLSLSLRFFSDVIRNPRIDPDPMVASASPMGNSGSRRSSPSSSPVAEAPDAEVSSGCSSVLESAEFYDRRDGDILVGSIFNLGCCCGSLPLLRWQTQVLSSRSEEYRLLFRLPPEEVSGVCACKNLLLSDCGIF